MEIFAALAFTIPWPDFIQKLLDPQTSRQPCISHFLGRPFILAHTAPHGRFVPFRLERLLDFEPDLRQDPDEELIHIMVDPNRSLDEFAVIRARDILALCKKTIERVKWRHRSINPALFDFGSTGSSPPSQSNMYSLKENIVGFTYRPWIRRGCEPNRLYSQQE